MAHNAQDQAPTLDHLILLVPHAYLESPPAAISNAFTITPGGRHAYDLTANILIPLRSGTYIELIAFLPKPDPSIRARMWWGAKLPGWIDWCLTTTASAPGLARTLVDVAAAKLRVGPASSALEYDKEPFVGERVRPDGQRVGWETTFPDLAYVRGSVPFWCLDTTPRELRVPGNDKAVTHANGAVGVAEVRLAARPEDLEGYAAAYAKLMGGCVERLVRDGVEDFSRSRWSSKQQRFASCADCSRPTERYRGEGNAGT